MTNQPSRSPLVFPGLDALKPNRLFKAAELVALIEPLIAPTQVLTAGVDEGSAQTGFCYTAAPHTVALAATMNWFKMANASAAISCIITSPEVARLMGDNLQKPTLVYSQAAEAFHFLHNLAIHQQTYEWSASSEQPQIASSASVHPTAHIEGNVIIEEGVQIGAHSVVVGSVLIGRDTVVREHCTIGTEGLLTKSIAGRRQHVSHYGGVSIGAGCQIHAGVNVSRSVNFRCFTILEDEVSLGIHANVGHDSHVGQRCTLSSKAILLGRVRVGDDCWIGAGAMISNGLTVGENSHVRLGAIVIKDLQPNSDVSCGFAQPHHLTLRSLLK